LGEKDLGYVRRERKNEDIIEFLVLSINPIEEA